MLRTTLHTICTYIVRSLCKEIHIENEFACVVINIYCFYKIYKLGGKYLTNRFKPKYSNYEQNPHFIPDLSPTSALPNEVIHSFNNYVSEVEPYYIHEENPWISDKS